jgi:hypothetical protein
MITVENDGWTSGISLVLPSHSLRLLATFLDYRVFYFLARSLDEHIASWCLVECLAYKDPASHTHRSVLRMFIPSRVVMAFFSHHKDDGRFLGMAPTYQSLGKAMHVLDAKESVISSFSKLLFVY